MRIFIVGATGVLARAATPHLQEHTLGGTTRSPGKLDALANLGVEGVVCDAYDARALTAAIKHFAPEVVVNLLTDLAGGPGPANARIRREACPNVTAAARESGARRLVVESIAFVTSRESDAAVQVMERDALGFEPSVVVLRFGRLWGPGTWYPAPPTPPRIQIVAAGRRAAEQIVGAATGALELTD